MFQKLAILLSCFAFLGHTSASTQDSCPFSKPPSLNCTCIYNTETDPPSINDVLCQVGDVDTLPKFDQHPGQYSLAGVLYIKFYTPKALFVESDSFVDFKSINDLKLESLNGITSITWNRTALRNVQISSFEMIDIFHFNSAFAALSADENSLTMFGLLSGGAYHLGANDLRNFKQLQTIFINDTSISEIDQQAFAGLEHILDRLYLTYADISESLNLFGAIKSLKELESLKLTGNNFKSVDLSSLDGVSKLNWLNFDANDLLDNITISNLDKVPSALIIIQVRKSGLKTIASSVGGLLDRPQFKKLDISSSTKLICDQNLQWMAKHALCNPIRLIIDDSRCSNLKRKSLESYLKENVPNPCKQ